MEENMKSPCIIPFRLQWNILLHVHVNVSNHKAVLFVYISLWQNNSKANQLKLDVKIGKLNIRLKMKKKTTVSMPSVEILLSSIMQLLKNLFLGSATHCRCSCGSLFTREANVTEFNMLHCEALCECGSFYPS